MKRIQGEVGGETGVAVCGGAGAGGEQLKDDLIRVVSDEHLERIQNRNR